MIKKSVLLTIFPVILLAISQCDGPPMPDTISVSVSLVKSPANLSTGEPNLAPAPSGPTQSATALLSWVETIDSATFLKLSFRDSSGWSDVKTVASGTNWFVNWADFPAVAMNDEGVILSSWLQKSSGGTYSYDIYLTTSNDRANEWTTPFVPHDDGTPTEHGFVSMEPLGADGFGLVWLDGRNTGSTEGTGESGGSMTVRFAVVSGAGAVTGSVVLDEKVCDCCQTAMTIAGDGSIVVAYRDRSDEEVRDISFVRRGSDGWSDPVSVSQDNWRIKGCPVNGPALASSDSLVVLCWFTLGENETPQVLCAFSNDFGKSFAVPRRLDSGDPLGRVDVVFSDAGTVLVSWLENTDDTSSVVVRAVRPNGEMSSIETVAESSSRRASGFARMAATTEGVWIAWTSLGEKSQVKTALITVN